MPEAAAAPSTSVAATGQQLAQAQPPGQSLVVKIAQRFNVEPSRMLATLKATAFHQSGPEVSNEQMMALLIVADQYQLNPFTRELYAFPDKNKGGIVPIVSVDGWIRILNERPDYEGFDLAYGPPVTGKKQAPEWIECTIHRKGRRPTTIRETLAECYRDTGPWGSHPSRMLRHKALIQAARAAFGFAGIYDEDEGRRIVEGEAPAGPESSAIAGLNEKIAAKPPQQAAGQVIDVEATKPQATAETSATPPPGAPVVTLDEILPKMRAATTREQLDELASSTDAIVDPEQRQAARDVYHQQLEILAGGA